MTRILETLTAARLIGRLRGTVCRLTFPEWSKIFESLPENERDEWDGVSPGGAAGQLGVSRQRIHQLLTQGKLNAVELIDEDGTFRAFTVTAASIRRYQESDRKPGPKRK
jgi:hypothetical protein